MTVSTQTNKNVWNADGVSTSYAFSFYCNDPSWVLVFVNGMLVSPSAINLNADQSVANGGVVYFTLPPPAGTANLVIQRVTPRTQQTLYTYLDAFPALAHMAALDKLTAMIQDTAALVGVGGVPAGGVPGDVLTADSFNNPVWATFISMFPPPVSGYVLGWNGTALEWVAGGGGGGGGVTIVGPVLGAGTPNAALITGSEIQLGRNNSTQEGVSFGTEQNIHDIRKYGAVSWTDPNTPATLAYDCTNAIYAAIAAWQQVTSGIVFATSGLIGGIYIPEGNWFISRPIVIPSGCKLFGVGNQLSYIVVGSGTPSTPTLVQGFGGPALYVTGPVPSAQAYPTYGPPLVGATGQSMVLTTEQNGVVYPPSLTLDDSYPWCTFLTWWAAKLGLRFFYKANAWTPGDLNRWCIGSFSPVGLGAVGVYVTSNGSTVTYHGFLTTANNPTVTIDGPPVASGAVVEIELSYDGSFFDFYVAGINYGHIAMSGRVKRLPWETSCIGDGYIEGAGFPGYNQPTGAIGSIELSSQPYHTGTGSYTPSTTPRTWQTNTIWLCNFDQPAAQAQQPMVVAQTAISTNPTQWVFGGPPTFNQAMPALATGGPVPHYMRLSGWAQGYLAQSAGVIIEDLQVLCGMNTSGIVAFAASRNFWRRCIVGYSAQWGVKMNDGGSFYSYLEDIEVGGIGVGIGFAGLANRMQTGSCGIGGWYPGGIVFTHFDQPGFNTFMDFVFGPGGNNYSGLEATGCGNDEEGSFPYQMCAAFMFGGAAPWKFKLNDWDSTAGPSGTPAVIYLGLGIPPNGIEHENDAFFALDPAVLITTYNHAPASGKIVCRRCTFNDATNITDMPGLLVVDTPTGQTNLTGLSTTDELANNLAGTFYILHGYTSGGPIFTTPEADTNYIVTPFYLGYVGSAPASGATVPGVVTNRTDGFSMTSVDPGSNCQTIWGYIMVRVPGTASLYEYLPTLPSNPANPLYAGGLNTGDWALGVTVVPIGRKTFKYDLNQAYQVIAESGNPSGPNGWRIAIQIGGAQLVGLWGGSNSPVDAQIAFPNLNLEFVYQALIKSGQLFSFMSPGPHNVIIGALRNFPGLGGIAAEEIWLDGGAVVAINPNYTGIQQTPMHVGQGAGGILPLATATLRNLKMDTSLAKVWTPEPDIGPQAGNTIAAFFGDQMTIGMNAGDAANVGGFATQIAEARYGTTYYYLAASLSATMLGQILPQYWSWWGGQQHFTGICVMAGFNDIAVNSALATDVWNAINLMVNGVKATSTFIPPVANQQSWCQFYVATPTWVGTPTCVINGVSFNCPFTTDQGTSITALAAAINASAPTNTIVTASAVYDSQHTTWVCHIEAKALGFAGDGIPVTATGVGNIYSPSGFSGTSNGANATLTINGVTFQAPFHTDADTTVNDLITLINANAPTAAIVTPSLVAHQLLLTAVVSGSIPNGYQVTTNGIGLAQIANNVLHLTGGVDGAISNGVGAIVLCTVPPFGDSIYYTSGKETQRNALNTLIRAATGAGVVVADVDVTLRNPADHTKINPTYLSADSINPNDAGHAALYTLLNPLLP